MLSRIDNSSSMLLKSTNSTKKTDETGKSQKSSLQSQDNVSTEAAELNMSVDSFVRSKSSEDSDLSESRSSGKKSSAVDVSKADKYGVSKLSESERSEIISQLKDEQEAVQAKFLQKMTSGTLGEQFRQWSAANSQLTQDGDGIWKFIASGNYTVDPETRAAAQEAISDGGYFSVEKTSQRIFDFVSAFAGDNVELMKSLQSAVTAGYNEATKAWGGELPEISKKTLEATNQLFDDYYKQHGA